MMTTVVRSARLLSIALMVALGAASALAAEPGPAGPPPDIAAQLRALGPVIDPPAVRKLYVPLLARQPTDGVTRIVDVAYGRDPRNRLDIYAPAERPAKPMPVLIFIHGGGFVAGDKAEQSNVGYYFARHGVLVLVANYRLAPRHKWPAEALDVAAATRWARRHVAAYGGNARRTFLMGQSAGAANVAAAALMRRLQPTGGLRLAGVILNSGVYDVALETEAAKQFGLPTPNKIDVAYFGADARRYPAMSTVRHLDAPEVPVMIVYTELDPAQMQVQAGELFTALCRRDHRCPALLWVAGHDHVSQIQSINTPDESVSRPILEFIDAH